MFTSIDHIALHVNNLVISRDFYVKNFCFKAYFENETPTGLSIIYMKLGDTILELTELPQEKRGFHFCIQTNSFDSDVKALLDSGVAMHTSPHETNPRTSEENGWEGLFFWVQMMNK